MKPEDLPDLLADAVDPDVLDALFDGRDIDGEIYFVFCGYSVIAWSDGAVDVTPATDPESGQ